MSSPDLRAVAVNARLGMSACGAAFGHGATVDGRRSS